MKRRAIALVLAVCSLSAPAAMAQYCPSYTLSSSANDHDCGIESVQGTNPTTAEWQEIFALVSKGPAAWGDQGPSVNDIEQGCWIPNPPIDVPARFPCELIKAIARAESGWQQFCVPTTPADQKGGPERTIISFDCGYGVGQVTSGMHIGEMPDFDRQRVASDAAYNLATGTRILAAKWAITACVGDQQPSIIEHWYSAAWAYNGLSYKNNPNNPNYDANRGVYDPKVGGSAPYQEKVFGRMEHTGDLWEPTEVAYPNPGDIGSGSKPNELPDPNCASPTDCVNSRPLHKTICHDDGSGGAGGAGNENSVDATVAAAATSGSGAGSLDDEDEAEPTGSDVSCSCSMVRPEPSEASWWWLLALALVLRRTSTGREQRD